MLQDKIWVEAWGRGYPYHTYITSVYVVDHAEMPLLRSEAHKWQQT